MKKLGVIILIITSLIFGAIIEILNISVASNNRYVATDKNIFGENALIIDSLENQSTKLENCIKKASIDNRELFIPAGKYYIDRTVSIKNSNSIISGDINDATILINRSKDKKTFIGVDVPIEGIENIKIKNLFLDRINMYIKNKNNITIENNIFYHSDYTYIVSVYNGKNININHNIFLRDLKNALNVPNLHSRGIYVGGYDDDKTMGTEYKWTENVMIKDNLIGAKIDELDALKSVQQDENKRNIERLQKTIKENKIQLENAQNYITTGINSYATLKNAYVENNCFYSNYDNQKLKTNPIKQDHATYFKGSQKVFISGNHMRGFESGNNGGFKFKSGKDVVVVNNYIRNSTIILSNRPEYGLNNNPTEGRSSQLTRFLIANNIFDYKIWHGSRWLGIFSENDNPNNLPTTIDSNVIIDNKYMNYINIERKAIRRAMQLSDVFTPENTYIKGNTRDDTEDKYLTSMNWKKEDEKLLAKDWRPLLNVTPELEKYYNEKKNIKFPFLNMLATAVPTTIELGKEISAENLVKNAYDKDNAKPTFTITNTELLKTVGVKDVVVKIKYIDQVPEVNITVPVTVQDTTPPTIEVKKLEFERGEKIEVNDIVDINDIDTKIDAKIEPKIDNLLVGKQLVKVIAKDSSGNMVEKEVEIIITKSSLQQEIENLFEENGIIKKIQLVKNMKY